MKNHGEKTFILGFRERLKSFLPDRKDKTFEAEDSDKGSGIARRI